MSAYEKQLAIYCERMHVLKEALEGSSGDFKKNILEERKKIKRAREKLYINKKEIFQ